MKAHLRSARIAPKKANLIAGLVRGMTVEEAMTSLSRTHKKAARMIEQLLKSAVANATHNDKQDPSSLVIKTIVVQQGAAYRRGIPMARGRMRPIRKFLSHISLTLGVAPSESGATAPSKTAKRAATTAASSTSASSQKKATVVQKKRSSAKKEDASSSASPSA